MSDIHLDFHQETFLVLLSVIIIAIFINILMYRTDTLVSIKSAVTWYIFWVFISIGYGGFLYIAYTAEAAILFITGYVLETMLSIDNLFIIIAIFAWFNVPIEYRYRILYWGIISAIILRCIFVTIGIKMLNFGTYAEVFFLTVIFWMAISMILGSNNNKIKDYSNHLVYRQLKHLFPIWPKITSDAFILSQKEVDKELVKPENVSITVGRFKEAKYYITPLFLCITTIELSDILLALDSVPVLIAISNEPLIVYSSMIFAMLGLRSLYFVIEILNQRLIYLKNTVILLLLFSTIKLGLNVTDHLWYHGYNISAANSLFIILLILISGILSSLIFTSKKNQK